MAKPPKTTASGKKSADLTDLPVLTEVSESGAHLPVLTEILSGEIAPRAARAAPLTEAQCAELAERLAPRLDALLREKLTLRVANAWLEAWAEVKTELPGLIRAELEATTPHSGK